RAPRLASPCSSLPGCLRSNRPSRGCVRVGRYLSLGLEVWVMVLDELLARYEALGEEPDFVAARALFERAAAEREDPVLLNRYGYLLESHGRNELRQAAALYERAIELDPGFDKPHYQLISARARTRRLPLRATAGGGADERARTPFPRAGLPRGARLRQGAGDRAGRPRVRPFRRRVGRGERRGESGPG